MTTPTDKSEVSPAKILSDHFGDGPCYYCGNSTNSLAGNPGMWPVVLCHSDQPGVPKPHHQKCINERLEGFHLLQSQLTDLRARVETLKIERDEARVARDFADLACESAKKRQSEIREEKDRLLTELSKEFDKAHADGAVMRGGYVKIRAALCYVQEQELRGYVSYCGISKTTSIVNDAILQSKSYFESASCGADLLKKLKNLEQLNVDACSDDTAIRDLCRPVLGQNLCDGDPNGAPTIVDVVESLLARYQEAVELLSCFQTEINPDQLKMWLAGSGQLERIVALLKRTETVLARAKGDL